MLDQQIENNELQAHWTPAVSPNQGVLWSKEP